MTNKLFVWVSTSVLLFLYFPLFSQTLTAFHPPVWEQGILLNNAFAGGLNQPQFSEIDLNFDGKNDLFVFDRSANFATAYLNTGTNGNLAYLHAPQYNTLFPHVRDWAILKDYNCDGKPDLFTSGDNVDNYVYVYLNTSSNNQVIFSPTPTGPLMADGDEIYVNETDIPAIIDVDNDGDLDMLTYDNQGFYMVYYQNLSQEQGQACNQLNFTMASDCWGNFKEEGLNNDIYLNMSCKKGRNTANATRHAGSTVTAFDLEGDGDKELLIGDISFDNLVYLRNGGDSVNANMDQYIYKYPDYDTEVRLTTFPAAFWIDADNDNHQDLIVAPNSPGVSSNFNCLLYYKNVGIGENVVLEYQNNHFLQNTMIEVGAVARPVFWDVNSDGKLDLIVGMDKYKTQVGDETADLAVYENIGTATSPEFQLSTRTYLDLNTVFENNQVTHIHPAFGDLDADGDEDLILGDFNGNVHYFRNIAPQGAAANFSLDQQNYKNIDIGASAMPFLIDLNQDGKLDLVIGEQMGNLNYYENIGTAQIPNFSATPTHDFLGGVDIDLVCCTGYAAPFFFENANGEWELLIGMDKGKIYHYNNIGVNTSFQLLNDNFGGVNVAGRCSPSMADLNGDGLYEIAIGTQLGGIELYSTSLNIGIADADIQPTWNLYPNPVHTTLSISFSQPLDIAQLSIWDMQGRQLASFPATSTELSVGNLASGIYLLQIVDTNGHFYFQKWAKE